MVRSCGDLPRDGLCPRAAELFHWPIGRPALPAAHHLRPHLLVHQPMPLPSPIWAGIPPDCVSAWRARDGFSYGALNGSSQLVSKQGPAADRHRRNRYFAKGASFCRRPAPFSRRSKWAAVFQRVVLGKPSVPFYRAGASIEFLRPALPDGGPTIWRM